MISGVLKVRSGHQQGGEDEALDVHSDHFVYIVHPIGRFAIPVIYLERENLRVGKMATGMDDFSLFIVDAIAYAKSTNNGNPTVTFPTYITQGVSTPTVAPGSGGAVETPSSGGSSDYTYIPWSSVGGGVGGFILVCIFFACVPP